MKRAVFLPASSRKAAHEGQVGQGRIAAGAEIIEVAFSSPVLLKEKAPFGMLSLKNNN